jgi:hypothetical protein
MLRPYGTREEHRQNSQVAPLELKNGSKLETINRRLLTEPAGNRKEVLTISEGILQGFYRTP